MQGASAEAGRSQSWGIAWLALTVSLGLHVWDEAAHDFLSVYNPTVENIRARWPLVPLPTFTFGTWIAGLSIAVIALGLLSPAAFHRKIWLRFVAYPYAIIMLLNGMQHIAASVVLGTLMPGALSSPLLIGASVALLIATRRATRPQVIDAQPLVTSGGT